MTASGPAVGPLAARQEPDSASPQLLGQQTWLSLPETSSPSEPVPTRAVPPRQCQIDAESPGLNAIAEPVLGLQAPGSELASGPHLRAAVLLSFVALWALAHNWVPQLTIVPFVLLCTTSTSALWCMPNEVVLSLGPVPVCFFRRRIPYKAVEAAGFCLRPHLWEGPGGHRAPG
mmetsp:Transcript_109593/g.353744  ORF Transcript_109593/g.353744 Transcript_109593/m.353744 type:complete len:174 (-) Transcript_109593:395-916(-)